MAQLTIDGIEATQSTQIFQSTYPLCGGMPCPDNSIPMVANRTTVLRVSISGGTPGNHLSAAVFALSPAPPEFPALRGGIPITAKATPPHRTNSTETVQVDFVISTVGTWDFQVLGTEFDSQWNAVQWTAPQTIRLKFEDRRLVRVRLVRIHYRNASRNLDLAAPTLADFWSALDFAHRALPVRMPGFEVVHDSVELYDGDFTRIDPSAHDTTWSGFAGNQGTTGSLLDIMDSLVAAESQPGDVIYVGIYPNGAQQSAYVGWAVSRWIISDRTPTTLAHEFAHKLCVPQHAPCGGPANVDPNYPVYGTNPSGSIGEVGFDPLLLTAYDPATVLDLMTYCSPRWISPYNYQKVFDCLGPLPPDSTTTSPFQIPTFHFVLVQLPDSWVSVNLPPVLCPQCPPDFGTGSSASVLLKDARGGVLMSVQGTLEPGSTEASPENPVWFAANIPLDPKAASFEVQIHGKTVFRDKFNGRPPRLRVKWPSPEELYKAAGKLTWVVGGKSDRVVVRCSSDAGKTWFARVLPGRQRSIDLGDGFLKPGARCALEVLVLRGYRCARAVSKTFAVAPKPAPLLILHPSKGAVYSPGDLVRFAAVSRSPAARISWFSDLDGHLGEGAFLRVPALQFGRHVIEARSDQPFESAQQVTVLVKKRPLRTTRRRRRKT
jgi:hypothetical protein